LFSSYRPGPPLRQFVHNFWCYEGYASPFPRERIFPDGTFKVVFNLQDDEFRIYDARQDGCARKFTGAMVSRPSAEPFVTDSIEESSVLGINFRLGGALPFLGLASCEPGESHVNLRDVCGPGASDVHRRLAECSDAMSRFRVLEAWLIRQLTRREHHHREVLAALDMLGHPRPGSRTREVARAVGLSERRFIELFKTQVAIKPKLFSRIRRFQHALSRIGRAAPGVDWAALAADCGYADQSHFIRDFEIFAGFTPVAYLNRHRHLVQQGVRAKPNHLPLVQ
jgi:AraC-like DNA-binding protein